MIRLFVSTLLAIGCCKPVQAALLVISEGHGQVNRQYFEQGEFVLMRGDMPSMGVDREGNCWFVQHRRVVFDSCEQMLQAVDGMRGRLMAGLDEADRATMERALQVQKQLPAASVRELAARKIAGYLAHCYRVGASREVCTSEKLLQEVRAEMGESQFFTWFRRFGESAGELGGNDPETRAVAELATRGFPMLDRRAVTKMPGIEPEVLQQLPEAQRKRIIAGIGDPAARQKMQGTRVTAVDRRAEMPKLELSRYPLVGFEQFMRQSMGR